MPKKESLIYSQNYSIKINCFIKKLIKAKNNRNQSINKSLKHKYTHMFLNISFSIQIIKLKKTLNKKAKFLILYIL